MTEVITVTQAEEWLRAGEAVLVDVREADEFKAERIVYGLSLPLSMMKVGSGALSIPKDKKLLFHCLKGMRSQKACDLMKDMGDIENAVYSVDGGIIAWKEAGLPVLSGQDAGLSIFRQVQIIVGGLIAFLVFLGVSGVGFATILAGVLGFALFFAGMTGWCGLAMLLSKMPWNK